MPVQAFPGPYLSFVGRVEPKSIKVHYKLYVHSRFQKKQIAELTTAK